jgi:amidase/aspartyl-tRNA(Asn)/glutamyl-tRNA(Gln) amidotransferase subunit A
MKPAEFAYRSATEVAALIRDRQLSPVESIECAIELIEERNPSLNAVIFKGYEDARSRAKAAEAAVLRGDELGALHGVPTLMKDLFDYKPGWPSTMGGIKSLKDNIADFHCPWAERVEAAGGIIVGKTNSPVMGYRGVTDNPMFGATRNPFDLQRNPGGSSGGSAACVADGIVPFAEGTDGGGSIRIPASWTNTYGFKGSFGRVPLVLRPNAFAGTRPTIAEGPITRTVEDAALVMSVLQAHDHRDPYSLREQCDFMAALKRQLDGLRVAYSPAFDVFPIDPRVAKTVGEAVRTFADIGATVDEVTIGIELDQMEFAHLWCRMIMPLNIAGLEGMKANGIDLMATDDLPPVYRGWVERTRNMTLHDLERDDILRTQVFDKMQAIFADYDLLITPTLSCLPPLNDTNRDTMGPSVVNGVTIDPSIGFCLTYPTNLTGHPSASLPAGLADGLPVGMQLIGPLKDDEVIIAASAAYERARPWAKHYEIPRSRSLK